MTYLAAISGDAMDTVTDPLARPQPEPARHDPVATSASDGLSAFLGSEDFPRFVLDCLHRAEREAAAENAKLPARK
jgi:hypothetical protein